jgi:hypothetical protein
MRFSMENKIGTAQLLPIDGPSRKNCARGERRFDLFCFVVVVVEFKRVRR